MAVVADDLAVAVDSATAFVVNPSVRVVRCTDDELVVKHGTRSLFSEIVSDRNHGGLLGNIIDRLRRPGTLDELMSEGVVPEARAAEATAMLGYLRDRGVIAPAEHDLARVYLDTIVGGTTRLRSATIAILGSGALARQIATGMAQLRPARIMLVAQSPMVGIDMGGVESTSHDVHLADDAAVRAVLEDADFAIAALDAWSPLTLHAINAAAIASRTTWMSVFFDGSEALVGPLYVPGETNCYFEYELQHEASLGLRDEYHLYKEALTDLGPEPSAFIMPAFVDTASGLAVTAAMKFLVTDTAYTVGRAVHVDFERGSIDYQDVFRLPRCPACSGLRPPQRHLFL